MGVGVWVVGDSWPAADVELAEEVLGGGGGGAEEEELSGGYWGHMGSGLNPLRLIQAWDCQWPH